MSRTHTHLWLTEWSSRCSDVWSDVSSVESLYVFCQSDIESERWKLRLCFGQNWAALPVQAECWWTCSLDLGGGRHVELKVRPVMKTTMDWRWWRRLESRFIHKLSCAFKDFPTQSLFGRQTREFSQFCIYSENIFLYDFYLKVASAGRVCSSHEWLHSKSSDVCQVVQQNLLLFWRFSRILRESLEILILQRSDLQTSQRNRNADPKESGRCEER